MFRRIYYLPLFLLVFTQVSAQEVTVKGEFASDSLKIGQQIPYTLTARYPRELNLVFPDSTFSFTPFEFQKKKFFQTQTNGAISYDSVIYWLSTFEVDPVQHLGLPVFVIHKKDCTAISAYPDSVFVVQLVKHVPDSVSAEKLPLKTNTAYQKVSWIFNYPIAAIAVGVLVVLALLTWLIFGKRIKKYYRVKNLTRRHLEFIHHFSSSIGQLTTNFSRVKAESTLVMWKNYMEGLLSKPYPKLTSREILHAEHDEKLGQSLKTIDRIIYGGDQPFTDDSFAHLKNYTELQFRKKLEEVKYG